MKSNSCEINFVKIKTIFHEKLQNVFLRKNDLKSNQTHCLQCWNFSQIFQRSSSKRIFLYFGAQHNTSLGWIVIDFTWNSFCCFLFVMQRFNDIIRRAMSSWNNTLLIVFFLQSRVYCFVTASWKRLFNCCCIAIFKLMKIVVSFKINHNWSESYCLCTRVGKKTFEGGAL